MNYVMLHLHVNYELCDELINISPMNRIMKQHTCQLVILNNKKTHHYGVFDMDMETCI